MDFLNKQIIAPDNWQTFEDLCHAIFKEVWADPTAAKNGRLGQAQAGTDIYTSRPPYVGVQCKGKDQQYGGPITEAELRAEIKRAEKFQPPLTHWYLVTTAQKDQGIETTARVISDERQKEGKFTVQVLGWKDLLHLINGYPAVIRQFYPEHAFDIEELIFKSVEAASEAAAHSSESLSHQNQLLDDDLQRTLLAIRQSRFFSDTNYLAQARLMAREILEGKYTRASAGVRRVAFAWLARLLSGDEHALAERCLAAAKQGQSDEIVSIAEALILDAVGKRDAALDLLGKVNSPSALTVTFVIRRRQEPGKALFQWVEQAGLSISSFDSDGKAAFIAALIALEKWDDAASKADQLTPEDSINTPVLTLLRGQVALAVAAPPELRLTATQGVPFNPGDFPLRDDSDGMKARRKAMTAFDECAAEALRLGCSRTSEMASDMGLWLRLRDPELRAAALHNIEQDYSGDDPPLRRLPLAMDFGKPLDVEGIHQLLNRKAALRSASESDLALARLTLAMAQKSPAEAASYVGNYKAELLKFLDPSAVQSMHVQLLSQSGAKAEATEVLHQWTASSTPPSEVMRSRLERAISQTSVESPVDRFLADFTSSNGLAEHVRLVLALEEARDWRRLAEFGATLFARTRQIAHAELAAVGLLNSDKFSELASFLSTLGSEFESDGIEFTRAFCEFRNGDFQQALARVKALTDCRDNRQFRNLEQNILISSGRWDGLASIVDRCWTNHPTLSPVELLEIAMLAVAIQDPRAKLIIQEAAQRANDDPDILAGAFFAATRIGWDDEPMPSKWLMRAATLSGEDGPVQKIALKDIPNMNPGWTERVNDTSRKVNQLELPMAAAAKITSETLLENTIAAAVFNRNESDARRRSLIFSFSAHRPPSAMEEVKSVALDPTALFNLHTLGLLGKVLARFDRVVLPHSTLGWLFEDSQRLYGVQAGEEHKAREILRMVADGLLRKGFAERQRYSPLAKEVGTDLAAMIEEAAASTDSDDAPSFVVRSAPVHRIGGFMEVEADLRAWSRVLVNCRHVVEAVHERGQLTTGERDSALKYLSVHEKEWGDPPKIVDGAKLYLDDLSVTYLQFCGVLEKISAAGLIAIASNSLVERSSLIARRARRVYEVRQLTESLQKSLKSEIASGRVVIAAHQQHELELEEYQPNPAIDAFGIEGVDAILCDDRYFNRHNLVTKTTGVILLRTTLDLLQDLSATNVISKEEYFDFLAKLRAQGHVAVPLLPEELTTRVSGASIIDGSLRETLELRHIRQYLARIRMHDAMLAESQLPWLLNTLRAFKDAIAETFSTSTDVAEARARADWLYDCFNHEGWARFLQGDTPERSLRMRALFAYSISAPFHGEASMRPAYFAWLEERLLRGLKETDEPTYKHAVSFLSGLLTALVGELDNVDA